MSSTTTFTSYLLATVTSTVAAGDPIPAIRKKEEMDKLMHNELHAVDIDGSTLSQRFQRVMWEDGKEQKSILDTLIPCSKLTIDDLGAIRYVKKVGDHLREGQPIFKKSVRGSGHQWKLGGSLGPWKKLRKDSSQLQSDDEDGDEGEDGDEDKDKVEDRDSMVETDGHTSEQSFHVGRKRSNAKRSSEEKCWERFLKNIHRDMLIKAKKSPSKFPFKVSDPSRYWSSEFSTAAVPDDTDLRKPDLVLMDYRLKSRGVGDKGWSDVLTALEITQSPFGPGNRDIPLFLGVATKGYLIFRAQPWRRFVLLFSIADLNLRAHYLDRSGMIISAPISIGPDAVRFAEVLNTITLTGLQSLGFDPTIHVCSNPCPAPSDHCVPVTEDGLPVTEDGLPVTRLPEDAKGWVMDNDNKVYWILAVLWKSRALFARGTVCYRVRDFKGNEYALKDCWVDEANLEHEVTLLNEVSGIPNVVSLVRSWDVRYNKNRDCTSNIRQHMFHRLPPAPIYYNRVHRRMLLTPCGLPLTYVESATELVRVFRDLVVAHEIMVTDRKVLHGDLSPHNLIIHDKKGYFIDFDHAKFLQGGVATDAYGTGTIPYMSSRLLNLLGRSTTSSSSTSNSSSSSTSNSSTSSPSKFKYRASDDLESLFYIFLEITTKYEGLGQMSNEGRPPRSASLWCKSYQAMNREGLSVSAGMKKVFIIQGESYKPTPFFKDCYPILEAWREAIAVTMEKKKKREKKREKKRLTHKEIREIINKGLMDLERSPPVAAPPLPPPTSLHPSAKTLPLTVPFITSDPNGLPPSAPGSTSRITRSMRKSQLPPPAVPNVSLPSLPSGSMAEDLDNGSQTRRSRRRRTGGT